MLHSVVKYALKQLGDCTSTLPSVYESVRLLSPPAQGWKRDRILKNILNGRSIIWLSKWNNLQALFVLNLSRTILLLYPSLVPHVFQPCSIFLWPAGNKNINVPTFYASTICLNLKWESVQRKSLLNVSLLANRRNINGIFVDLKLKLSLEPIKSGGFGWEMNKHLKRSTFL